MNRTTKTQEHPAPDTETITSEPGTTQERQVGNPDRVKYPPAPNQSPNVPSAPSEGTRPGGNRRK
jgi:hypothetical protein